MPAIELILAYDGLPFNGWQIQANGVGVQALLQRAVRTMTKERTAVIGASRTDAGVHALAQVAHFHTKRNIPPHGWLRGLNSLLPASIRVRQVRQVPATFHARRSAKWKRYRYLISTGPVASPFLLGRAWHIFAPLDLRAMRSAATALIGRHDFRAFAAANDGSRSKVRRIYSLKIRTVRGMRPAKGATPKGGCIAVIDIIGDGFLKQMVRNIVGTLVEVGQGKRAAGDIGPILTSQNRRRAGRCAPPGGLYLVEIGYRLPFKRFRSVPLP
ncbi:MAG: tRNA pseudouridine(38-40) synthase TruA [Deltaproteobacteria bacterium]|nr:tRNA pseudouridine(38-40) synthase TruA [Deltaproteobacteria bacterium]